MKNTFIMIGRIIAALFGIFTIIIIIMIMLYKDIDNILTQKFVKIYLVLLFLFILYLIITLSAKIRNLKWKRISKLLFRWFIWSIALWISTVLIIYLVKGELRLTERIFSSIAIAFGSVFGGLIFGSNDYN